MTADKDTARAERLKAALRDNLRRRKAQGRGRAEPTGEHREPPDEAAPRDAGDAPSPDEACARRPLSDKTRL